MALPINESISQVAIPGVLAIDWMPSFGTSQGPNDPASRVAQEIYKKVRAAYSGALEADGPDMLMYLGALDSIFAYIGWLKRLYRCISTYSPDNFTLPNALLMASGFAGQASGATAQTLFARLRSRKDLLFTGINELIHMTEKFKCPAVMDVFNRHYWMSDNVYADANSPRAQLYLFNLVGVYQLQLLTMHGSTDKAAGLQMIPVPQSFASTVSAESIVDTLINLGVSLVTALDTWDDGYTISGYLTRAFDGVPSFAVAPLLPDENITVTYSEEVLSQIENAHCCINDYAWAAFAADNFSVVQDVTNNSIWTNQTITRDTTDTVSHFMNLIPSVMKKQVLNVRSDNPSVGDTVIATRLHNVPNVTETSTTAVKMQPATGSEIVLQFRICSTTSSGLPTRFTVPQYYPVNANKMTGATMIQIMTAYALLSQFDWHPLCYMVCYEPSPDNTADSMAVLGDVLNPTVITDDQLALINKYCLYSEFNAFSIM